MAGELVAEGTSIAAPVVVPSDGRAIAPPGVRARQNALAAAAAGLASAIAPPDEELKLTALASDAAGSLRSPAALLMMRRRLTPAR